MHRIKWNGNIASVQMLDENHSPPLSSFLLDSHIFQCDTLGLPSRAPDTHRFDQYRLMVTRLQSLSILLTSRSFCRKSTTYLMSLYIHFSSTVLSLILMLILVVQLFCVFQTSTSEPEVQSHGLICVHLFGKELVSVKEFCWSGKKEFLRQHMSHDKSLTLMFPSCRKMWTRKMTH